MKSKLIWLFLLISSAAFAQTQMQDLQPASASPLTEKLPITPQRLCCYSYLDVVSVKVTSQSTLDTYNNNQVRCPGTGQTISEISEYGSDEGDKWARKIYAIRCSSTISACSYIKSDENGLNVTTPSGSTVYVQCTNNG